jgi:threonine dehydrogenase-like Zn-dependent dehydrogenase
VLDYEDAPLQPGQVRVKTELASGKHGTTTGMFDGRTYQGQDFDQQMRLFVSAEDKPKSPSGPGNSGTTGVGTIVEVGPEVTRWQVGDRVFGFMDVRETNVCHQDRIWELGDVDPELALCLEPAYVAIHCVRESHLRYGDTVAVIGLGALGLLAVRMAAEAGAETVFAADLLPARRAWALQNGADYAFDPATCDVALEVHRLLGGSGVDVAIELAGAYPALNTAIRCVRVAGTVCSAGFYQGEARGLWLGREWHHNRISIVVPHGCGWGHPPRDYPGWDAARANECIVSMMRKGKLTAPGLITPIVSLADAPEVFRMMRDEPERVIKYGVRF